MSVHDNFDLSGFLKSKKLLKENQESKEANKWDNQLEDEMKWELLLTAVKDPKEAEKYIELKWNNLPPEVQSNIDWSKESEGQELDEAKKTPLKNDDVIYDTLNEMDHEYLVSTMLEAAEINPSLTLKDWLEKFSEE